MDSLKRAVYLYQPEVRVLVIYMQLSETPKLGFTGAANANLLIHIHPKCPKYWLIVYLHMVSQFFQNDSVYLTSRETLFLKV